MMRPTPISLERVHAALGWSTPAEILQPHGAGAAMFAALVREKVGRALQRAGECPEVRIGILAADPQSRYTDPPLAIVVEFQQDASQATLRELHRLSWNFSHSPALITIEPALLRVWSCCEAPAPDSSVDQHLVHQVTAMELNESATEVLENRATRALHWINLVSGTFFSEHPNRFDRDGRADQMLLGNLRHIRAELRAIGLSDDDVCHDLLARIIFVQFLFDRKDSDGVPALTLSKLARLHADGVLTRAYTSFDGILSNYKDTYSLFDWLNERFNGDLFPGKGDTATARAQGWAKEKRTVTKQHLALLADFIRGNIDMPTGQRCLWPQYSFDVIPLEFISSIYETFVDERAAEGGVFYTPPHLVDFILDRVLPWGGTDWDLKVLDPACGSGIFLVKTFQRLVHRWRRANPGQPVRADLLRRLLERNLFGVDLDPHAVRVACFSLYLAMCDEIEPRHYWTQVVFPTMRERRLLCSDFFAAGVPAIDTASNAASYDLIVGNAPWGEDLVTDAASTWAISEGRAWTVANKDIGGLFLAKAAQLLSPRGRIAMIQSANAFLFNGSRKALQFRTQLFTAHRVEEVVNLAALRFGVFKRKSHTTKRSVSPACVVVMSAAKPELDSRIAYTSPKRLKPHVDEFTIVIEPHDRRSLTIREALTDHSVWSTLMWGGPRDRALLKKLGRFPTISAPGQTYKVLSRQGVIYGDRQRSELRMRDRPLFSSKTFPPDSILFLDTNKLPAAGEIKVHSRDSTDFSAFAWPQLILKKGWQNEHSRFQARLARSVRQTPALFSDSYVSVHGPADFLEAACLSLNSLVAVYFLQLTSGRIAAYRPAALKNELLDVPVPHPRQGLAEGVEDYAGLDARVYEAFGLKDAERVLVEDLCNYVLPEFRGYESHADTPLRSNANGAPNTPMIEAYCEFFMRVLRAGFGQDKIISARIFHAEEDNPLPYQMVAFELGGAAETAISNVRMRTVALLAELERLDLGSTKERAVRRGIYTDRVVRLYDASNGTPTICIIKPNVERYWTRTAGLNDGDEVALDLFRWQQHTGLGSKQQ